MDVPFPLIKSSTSPDRGFERKVARGFFSDSKTSRSQGSIHGDEVGFADKEQKYHASITRFHFDQAEGMRQRPINGHLDVFSSWERDPILDTDIWSPNMRNFIRLPFVQKSKTVDNMADSFDTWQRFLLSERSCNLEELARWLASLTPRSIHDLKPLLVLLQSVAASLLNREIDYMATTVKMFNKRLRNKEEIIQVQAEQLRRLEQELAAYKAEGAERHSQPAVRSRPRPRDGENGKGHHDEVLQMKLEEMQARAEMAEKASERLGAQLKATEAKLGSTTSQFRMLSSAANKMALDNKTNFMPWATLCPILDLEWAAHLMNGQVTMEVPWGSTIQLHEDSYLREGGHVVDIPAQSCILLPRVVQQDSLPVMLVKDSCVKFENITEPQPVTVPGGTSIILPDLPGQQRISIEVPAGSSVHPRADLAKKYSEANPMIRQNYPQRKLPEADTHSFFTPFGAPSVITVNAGSTIITPQGPDEVLLVPSECKFTVPAGVSERLHIPPGSTVMLPPACPDEDFTIFVPCSSRIYLPMEKTAATGAAQPAVPHDECLSPSSKQPNLPSLAPSAAPQKGQPSETMPGDHSSRAAPTQPSPALATKKAADSTSADAVTEEDTPERVRCSVYVPGGTHISLPSSEGGEAIKHQFMVPPGTHLKHSDQRGGQQSTNMLRKWESANMAIHSHDGGIYWTATAENGSEIFVPHSAYRQLDGRKEKSEYLARCMSAIGEEASGHAVAAMDPVTAATVLSHMPVATAANILMYALPEAASQVFQHMRTVPARAVLQKMSPDAAAHALMHMEPLDFEKFMDLMVADKGADLHKMCERTMALKQSRDIVAGCDSTTVTTKATNSAVEMLSKRDSNIVSRVLSAVPANRAAITLNDLASHGLAKCADVAVQLGRWATRNASLSQRNMRRDMLAAALNEQLSKSETEMDLQFRAQRCLDFFKEEYGFNCTLCRTPWSLDTERVNHLRLAGEAGIQGSEREYLEQQAEKTLDILLSTEEISWGAITPSRPGKASGIHMSGSAQELQRTQEKALQAQEIGYAFCGPMLIFPIFIPRSSGSAPDEMWGTISLVTSGLAENTTQLGLPKAVEALQQLSVALRITLTRITRANERLMPSILADMASTGCNLRKAKPLKQSLSRPQMAKLIAGARPPPLPLLLARGSAPGPHADRTNSRFPPERAELSTSGSLGFVAANLLACAFPPHTARRTLRYMHIKRNLAFELETPESVQAFKQLMVKGMPGIGILRLLVATLVVLGTKGFETWLQENLSFIPGTSEANQELWKYTCSCLTVDRRHPQCINHHINHFGKGLVGHPEQILDKDMQHRISGAASLLSQEVTRKEVEEEGGRTMVALLDWLILHIKQCYVQMELSKPKSDMNIVYGVKKKSMMSAVDRRT
ncbi:hypothetical protein CYMTET_14915 [Cymbomonas tetramitiformis]|uniref:Magnesium transporter MgtE intracellular domain-containing protein n=1 Tax=Cymbomonas tetramitiformis TaxID=36881 RepID=A0AAE0L9F8_9CHLO|nr:hypothetical protein CYMTET_14915 [Cymbomonas tetramitiformis]